MSKRNFPLGSVSHGTLRAEDLIPVFLDVLETVAMDFGTEEDRKRFHKIECDINSARLDEDDNEREEYYSDEQADEDVSNLIDMLSDLDCVPPYVYFGASEGDGSDFGFWISWDTMEDEDYIPNSPLFRISAGEAWPEPLPEGVEYVLEVSDHGNATLYNARTKEIYWEVV